MSRSVSKRQTPSILIPLFVIAITVRLKNRAPVSLPLFDPCFISFEFVVLKFCITNVRDLPAE